MASLNLIIILVATVLILVAILVGFSAFMARKVEALIPPEGRFITVEGARVHYVDIGQGPVIVMIHGLGGQIGNFTYALADLLKGRFRLLILDRPGAGYSTAAPGASSRLTVQADLIAGFITALDLGRPLLVGHSMGGAIALATALRHPDRVSGLALIAPLTQTATEAPDIFRSLAIASPVLRRMVSWTLAVPLSILKGEATLNILFSPQSRPADLGIRGRGLLSLRPKSFYATSKDMMALGQDLPSQVAAYSGLTLPVGVLFGTRDAILDHRLHGEGLARQIAYVDLELIEDGGHMLPISHPDACAAFVTRMAHPQPKTV